MLLRVDGAQFFLNKFRIKINFDFMLDYTGVDSWDFLVGPRKNIMKFFNRAI